MITAYFRHLRYIFFQRRKVEPPDPVESNMKDKSREDQTKTLSAIVKKGQRKDQLKDVARKKSILSIWV